MRAEQSEAPYELMGFASSKFSNEEKLANALEKGLPYRAYTHLGLDSSISKFVAQHVLGISPATLKRRAKAKHFNPDESNKLYRFATLIADAKAVFDNDMNKTFRWLTMENRALSGDTPLKRLKTEIGYQQVGDLLNRIRYGIYS